MPVETQVDMNEITAAFKEKLTEKDAAIATLTKELETIKMSATKAELDKRDNEIKELKGSVDSLSKEVASLKIIVTEKEDAVKAAEVKTDEAVNALKTKSEEVEKINKDLTEIKQKQVLATRIATYRSKSGDVNSTDEDLAKKFGGLTDEAFDTVLEFVKKTEPVVVTEETDPAKLAEAALKKVEAKTEPTPAPTSTVVPNSNPFSAVASKLFGELFGTEVSK
jgi:chromosome segregation ATPase